MLEKWKSAVAKQKQFGALLTDLFKAFDCVSYDLLIAKLNVYRLSIDSVRLVQDYLTNRNQRSFSGTNFRASFIHHFLCDLFFIIDDTDFLNYADITHHKL